MTTEERVASFAKILEDKKAIDLLALNVRNLTIIAESFIICTGISTPHCQALADELQEKMGQAGEQPARIEGYREGKWILMDYGDVIVHIFNEETRKFYNLEWLWADADKLNTK